MQWPEELVRDLARRRVVLYLGAGVSAAAESESGKRTPTWETFLLEGVKKLKGKVPSDTIKDLIKGKDYLSACELLEAALDEGWVTYLRNAFVDPGFTPASLHRDIHDLDASVVITPNFDTIYDRFAVDETKGSTLVKNYYDEDVAFAMRGPSRVVLKVHGSIDTTHRMVFSRREYAEARNHHHNFFKIMEALFLTHTVLFIGSSLNDPDLMFFLENLQQSHPLCPPHYMTTPTGEIHKHRDDSIRLGMNLKLLRYSPKNGHQELHNAITELRSLVDQERTEMGPVKIGDLFVPDGKHRCVLDESKAFRALSFFFRAPEATNNLH